MLKAALLFAVSGIVRRQTILMPWVPFDHRLFEPAAEVHDFMLLLTLLMRCQIALIEKFDAINVLNKEISNALMTVDNLAIINRIHGRALEAA